jgi:hypothetical protein
MPVGSGRFRDHAQDPQRSLGHVLFLFPCSQARGLCGTPKGTMLGMKSRFLLSEATTGNKLEKHPTYKSNLFPAPHSLPFSSVRGTDIPNSQYKYILRFHYSTNMGQFHFLFANPERPQWRHLPRAAAQLSRTLSAITHPPPAARDAQDPCPSTAKLPRYTGRFPFTRHRSSPRPPLRRAARPFVRQRGL